MIDVWLDDPFTDLMFHRKVRSMRRTIEHSRAQLDEIVAGLEASGTEGRAGD